MERRIRKFNTVGDEMQDVNLRDVRRRILAMVTVPIYLRGRRYYLEGRVKNLKVEDLHVEATVRGNDEYHVRIDLSRGSFQCTCPYQGICKHIVAVILATEEYPGDDLRERIRWIARRLRDLWGERDLDALITHLEEMPLDRAEPYLREAFHLFMDTELEADYIRIYLEAMERGASEGVASVVPELLRRDPLSTLVSLSKASVPQPDARKILEILPEKGTDPVTDDLLMVAKTHLMAILGRAEVSPDDPVEAIAEGIRNMVPEERLELIEKALKDRTPRERLFLLKLKARSLRDLSSCEEMEVLREILSSGGRDREIISRLLELSPMDAIELVDDPFLLVDLMLEKGMISNLKEMAMSTNDHDLLAYIIEIMADAEIIARYVELLAKTGERDVAWRVRYALDTLPAGERLSLARHLLEQGYRGKIRSVLQEYAR